MTITNQWPGKVYHRLYQRQRRADMEEAWYGGDDKCRRAGCKRTRQACHPWCCTCRLEQQKLRAANG